MFAAVADTQRGNQDFADRARDRSTRDASHTRQRNTPVPGTTRVAEPQEPPRRQGGNLVQQVLRLATQMDKEDTKKTGTSTTEPKRRGR